MSAAATAAGYLYASGRLRGRGAREQEHAAEETTQPRRPVRVAALPSEERPPAPEPAKRAPRIQYRTRRWRPGQQTGE
jgi:hypothetical protein